MVGMIFTICLIIVLLPFFTDISSNKFKKLELLKPVMEQFSNSNFYYVVLILGALLFLWIINTSAEGCGRAGCW